MLVATIVFVCMSCLTQYEAVALNSVALVTAGTSLWQRVTSRVPRDVALRRVWDDNAELMRKLGLDPEAVLGPPPSVAGRPREHVLA
jgi:hypothetical protein